MPGARNSIGIMLVSGMIIGTLFTLFVVPSIYMLLARRRLAVVASEDAVQEIIAGRVRRKEQQHERQSPLPTIDRERSLAVSLLLTAPAAAQVRPVETLRLTLDEAIRYAVENNPELEIAGPSTQKSRPRGRRKPGAFAPVFSTQLGRSGAATPSTNLLFGERGVNVRLVFIDGRATAPSVGIRDVEYFLG